MPTHPAENHTMCGLRPGACADEVIAALADAQHGVVSRTQLLFAGVTAREIEWRLRRKRLRRLHYGVYAVGHRALTPEGVWMAAVLAAGPGAVLSHWSAASLWRMRPGRGPRSHVTIPRERRNRRSITFHHAQLAPDEVTAEQGIPVTTPARTQLDLAPYLSSPVLARMIDAAGPCEGAPLARLLDRYPHRAGAHRLRSSLAEPGRFTRSDLEAKVLDAIERAGLPRPQVNTLVEGYEVDFAWPQHGVIAELDTYSTHGSPLAFERDRVRDRKLTAAALDDLSRLLAASAARSPSRRAAAW